MFHQPDLFDTTHTVARRVDLPWLIERIAEISPRPRYAFLILNLIAKAAGEGVSAGPYVVEGGRRIPIRDWLCEAMLPLAQRDSRRRAVVEAVRGEIADRGLASDNQVETERLVRDGVRSRVLRSGRSNVSRAVSDLVRAGLLKRHYQGYRVDHINRGGQREAVYTLTFEARHALRV
jgi:hypothetical protein